MRASPLQGATLFVSTLRMSPRAGLWPQCHPVPALSSPEPPSYLSHLAISPSSCPDPSALLACPSSEAKSTSRTGGSRYVASQAVGPLLELGWGGGKQGSREAPEERNPEPGGFSPSTEACLEKRGRPWPIGGTLSCRCYI